MASNSTPLDASSYQGGSERGDWHGAVDDVILGLQFGCDVTRRNPVAPVLMGRAIVGIVTEGAGESLKPLAAGNLEQFHAKSISGLILSEWRSGFSLKIAARDVDVECARQVEEAREALSTPWAACDTVHGRWFSRSVGGPARRIIHTVFFLDLTNQDEVNRLSRSHLRLACASALHRAGQDNPMPQDPFTLSPS